MSKDLTHERHVCVATISNVVHFSEGVHCFLRLRMREGVKVKDTGTSGWDCKYWLRLKFSLLGAVLVNPGCVKVT